MGRLSAPLEPEHVGHEVDLWHELETLGTRLASSVDERGFATATRNEWLRLGRSKRPVSERIRLLIDFAIERGCPAVRVWTVVGYDRDRLRRKQPPPGGARLARRRRLETNWKETT